MLAAAVAAPPTPEVMTQALGKSSAALDISLWGLITHADFVVQLVMLLLLVGSIVSWAITFNKYRMLKGLKTSAGMFERQFWDGGSLESLFDRSARNPQDPFEEVFCAGMREWKDSAQGKGGLHHNIHGIKERIERAMSLTAEREITQIRKGTTYLATLASSAPFIGLFGTVWGIMSSFQSIAMHQNTNLAVVAPGIAEALFATALGLFAAIPAVIFYNAISLQTKRYAANLDAFMDEFMNIMSRQMDEMNRTA